MDGKIRIRLKGFDHAVIDPTTADIVRTAEKTGATISGPIPLPTRVQRWTVNRSPHVDKKSREQFELKTHKREIDLTPEQLAAMADYQRARRGFANDVGLADVLGVHRTRLAAWKRGTVAPNTENARALSYLSVVVRELEEFLDPDVIADWMLTEQITLSGRTPAEAIRDGRLADVLYAANATEHVAYV